MDNLIIAGISACIGGALGGVAYPIVKDWGISKEVAGLTRRMESLEGRINNVKSRASVAESEGEIEEALAEFVAGMSAPDAKPMELLKTIAMKHPAIAKKIMTGRLKI